MNNRWYDLNPTVNLAVKLMETAEAKAQHECACYVIQKAKEYGVRITENDLSETFNYLFRRWYDKNKHLHDAFEYFKMAPYDVQLGIALDVIDRLQPVDKQES